MKKVSTVAGEAARNSRNHELTIGLDLGDRFELVLRVGRSRESAAGTKAEHSSSRNNPGT